MSKPLLLTLAALSLLLPALGADATDPEAEPEAAAVADVAPRSRAYALAQVRETYEIEHFQRCDTSSGLLLNEICSVGSECNRDVRIADYIEVYNAGASELDLECYVLTTSEHEPFVPRGKLAARQIQAWGEKQLGFRIAKKLDEVFLYRMGTNGEGAPDLVFLESLHTRANQAHSYRVPDGGYWKHLTADEAEDGWPGTYGEPNTAPERDSGDLPTAR